MILNSKVTIDTKTGKLTGDIIESQKKLSDLVNVFENEDTRKTLDQDSVVYRVEAYLPEKDGTVGGLFFGTSYINPGLVGDEYFMTKGHFHNKIDTAEFYWCISGEGLLLLMDENYDCYAEKLYPGSLHYIPRKVAHRLVNTGNEVLAVGACWPSDAGHDYDTITAKGFTKRVKKINGKPTLV